MIFTLAAVLFSRATGDKELEELLFRLSESRWDEGGAEDELFPNRICQQGELCNECEQSGTPCALARDTHGAAAQHFGVCTKDYEDNRSNTPVFKCKAQNSGNHGTHAVVHIHQNSLTAPIRPPETTHLTLPANNARSYAVVFSCVIARSRHIVDAALDAGARVLLVGYESACAKFMDISNNPQLEILHIRTSSDFIRDYGSFFVLEKQKRAGQDAGWTRIWNVDHQYDILLNMRNYVNDWFPIRFAHYVGAETLMNTLRYVSIEGGNVVSNGQGVCLMTKLVLCKNAQLGYRPEWEHEACRDWTDWGRDADQADPDLEANGWGPMDFDMVKLGSIFDDLGGNSTKKQEVAAFVSSLLRQHFGCDPLFLEGIPYDDRLDHVDMYYFFLNEATLLMGTYNETTWMWTHDAFGTEATYPKLRLTGAYDKSGRWAFTDPVSDHSDNVTAFQEQRAFKTYVESAWRNKKMLTQRGLTVLTTSMPRRVQSSQPVVFFTHLNAVVVSNVHSGALTVLMPTYAFPTSKDSRHMAEGILNDTRAIFEDYGWKVVVVEATRIQQHHGAIHCVTKTIPYVSGGCAERSTHIKEYYQCLEDKIPEEDKQKLRQREFEAEIQLRNTLTQRLWNCTRTPDLLCELQTAGTTTAAAPLATAALPETAGTTTAAAPLATAALPETAVTTTAAARLATAALQDCSKLGPGWESCEKQDAGCETRYFPLPEKCVSKTSGSFRSAAAEKGYSGAVVPVVIVCCVVAAAAIAGSIFVYTRKTTRSTQDAQE